MGSANFLLARCNIHKYRGYNFNHVSFKSGKCFDFLEGDSNNRMKELYDSLSSVLIIYY